MRNLVFAGVAALACAGAPVSCLAKDPPVNDAAKADQVDAFAREHLGIGIQELAWLIGAECKGSIYATGGMDFIARKPALDRLEQKGFVRVVEAGSAEYVAICPTSKGAAVRDRLLRAGR